MENNYPKNEDEFNNLMENVEKALIKKEIPIFLYFGLNSARNIE